MKPSFRITKGILLLLPFIFSFCLLLQAAEEELSLEEISKTQAAKFYINRQYQESLTEFQNLETEYPHSTLIKRYIASLYDALGQRDKAVEKMREAIEIGPDEAVSHQMLGDLYLKQVDLDAAQAEYEWIKTHSASGSKHAEYADQKIEQLKKIQSQTKSREGERMSVQDFMRSPAAQNFSKGNYEEALHGFDELLITYPQDILIRRFRGIVLTRLGRYEEAIQEFQQAKEIDSKNAAVRFYLGQAYLFDKKHEEAKHEFQWIIKHDEGPYKGKSQQTLFQMLGQGGVAPGASKKWTASINAGYEYDTNAIYKSRDTDVSSAGDQNSGRYITGFSGTYRAYQNKKITLTTDGFYAQTLYNDFINLNTYTFGGGLSGLYGFKLFSKPVFFNLRNGLTETLLRNRFYVWSNTLSPSFVIIPHPRLRSAVSYRFVYSHYHDKVNTSLPERNSRDGYTYGVAFSNTLYLNQKKNLYVTLGTDYEHAAPKGLNYIKNAVGFNAGLHFPVIEKVEGDVQFRFRDSDYPKTFLPQQRRDDLYNLSVSLSRPLTAWLNLTLMYLFEDTNARNNVYEYYKNTFGVHLNARF